MLLQLATAAILEDEQQLLRPSTAASEKEEAERAATAESRARRAADAAAAIDRMKVFLLSLSCLSLSASLFLSATRRDVQGRVRLAPATGIRNSNALSSSSSSSFSFESKKKKEWRAQLKASRTFFFSFDHRNFFTLRLFQPSVPLPFLPPLLHT